MKTTKPEIWNRDALIWSYLPYESDVTKASGSPLLDAMTRAVLEAELTDRAFDLSHKWDRRIVFLEDSDKVVWARVHSKPAAAGEAENCIGTYTGLHKSSQASHRRAMDVVCQ